MQNSGSYGDDKKYSKQWKAAAGAPKNGVAGMAKPSCVEFSLRRKTFTLRRKKNFLPKKKLFLPKKKKFPS
jgi:hypothetical protein